MFIKIYCIVGWKCNRAGCSLEYCGPQSDAQICVYHPGNPIFHEGMKYWSCCERKTSDFTSFLNQVGCEKADKWVDILLNSSFENAFTSDVSGCIRALPPTRPSRQRDTTTTKRQRPSTAMSIAKAGGQNIWMYSWTGVGLQMCNWCNLLHENFLTEPP